MNLHRHNEIIRAINCQWNGLRLPVYNWTLGINIFSSVFVFTKSYAFMFNRLMDRVCNVIGFSDEFFFSFQRITPEP